MTQVEFLKPDKGSVVVIMTKDICKSKTKQILMNEDKFKLDETYDNRIFSFP